jgi:hypothetical protein
MAQKTVVTLTDDIDGKTADETIRFGLDGVNYEIDLRRANADKLRDALRPFQEAARKVSTGRRGRGRGGRATAAGRDRSAEIRSWAKQHGLRVSERGRIAADLAAAYDAGDPERIRAKQAADSA